jgi:hypothetical protein
MGATEDAFSGVISRPWPVVRSRHPTARSCFREVDAVERRELSLSRS